MCLLYGRTHTKWITHCSHAYGIAVSRAHALAMHTTFKYKCTVSLWLQCIWLTFFEFLLCTSVCISEPKRYIDIALLGCTLLCSAMLCSGEMREENYCAEYSLIVISLLINQTTTTIVYTLYTGHAIHCDYNLCMSIKQLFFYGIVQMAPATIISKENVSI